jgi:tRNA A37 threonylcarbamoyladenosine synthetase subunit TsaC/SUA5/YrdC
VALLCAIAIAAYAATIAATSINDSGRASLRQALAVRAKFPFQP